MRWFGYVKCRDEYSILRRAMELEVEGRRPVGRPKKTWSKVHCSGRRHEEAKYHRRYGRGQETVQATHITSNLRSGKLGMLNNR